MAFALQTWTAYAAAPKVLIVVAHPDDEYYFAATVYRIAHELEGTVDQVIITNGEGGYRYSLLAERHYGRALTDEKTGRRALPDIRKKEVRSSGKILGIRRHYFLNQRDARFTLNAGEALSDVWNCDKVRGRLAQLLQDGNYDLVFTMLPRQSTHGHHQAATILALEEVAKLPEARRPVVLGAEPGRGDAEPFQALPAHPITATVGEQPAYRFDRNSKFGFREALSYQIVVNWVVAEHKSQGLFQTDIGRHDAEWFWVFSGGPPDAKQRLEELLAPACKPH